jgi:hypothetical protein
MKAMKPDQIREVMIEIIMGRNPSNLKKEYPKQYQKIRNIIVDIHSAGGMVRIPEK